MRLEQHPTRPYRVLVDCDHPSFHQLRDGHLNDGVPRLVGALAVTEVATSTGYLEGEVPGTTQPSIGSTLRLVARTRELGELVIVPSLQFAGLVPTVVDAGELENLRAEGVDTSSVQHAEGEALGDGAQLVPLRLARQDIKDLGRGLAVDVGPREEHLAHALALGNRGGDPHFGLADVEGPEVAVGLGTKELADRSDARRNLVQVGDRLELHALNRQSA